MRDFRRWALALGMLGAALYVAMVLIGQALRPAYAPESTFISHLTAVGAPNARALRALNDAHGICLLIFAAALWQGSRWDGGALTRKGYSLLLAMMTLNYVGYAVCPLMESESFTSLRNLTHFVMSIALILAAMASILMIGVGYRRQAGERALGAFCLVMDGLIAAFGVWTLLSMWRWPGTLGLAQRAMVFSLDGFIFGLSLAHTLRAARPVFLQRKQPAT